jgi:hypothetical protein
VSTTNTVTEEYLGKFKAGDLVDVKTKYLRWSGPHKLLVYKIDPPTKYANAAAYVEIELGQKRLERWLIVGEQQLIRKHLPEEQKQRVRVKRVK